MGFSAQKNGPALVNDNKTYSFDGDGRHRISKEWQTELKSIYQFSIFKWDSEGRRYALPTQGCSKEFRDLPTLICTTVLNRATGTETVLFLHFDLDYKRADDKWKKNGKLDWGLIGNHVREAIPVFFKYSVYITESTGGQGLAIALAISPLELIPSTKNVQSMAHQAQAQLIQALNFYGLGADPGATGLRRLMPNFFKLDRLVDENRVMLQHVQTKRPRVLQEILFALRVHPALQEVPKKKRRDEFLWPDIRLEKPLAQLYLDLIDEVGPWGSEQTTAQALIKRLGVSKTSIYKILNAPPGWLRITPIPGEGYRLQVIASESLTSRAYAVLSMGSSSVRKSHKAVQPSFHTLALPPPEKVAKGERNTWLKDMLLALKWKGIAQQEAASVAQNLIPRVPGWRASKSLGRDFKTIIKSIYRNRPGTYGSNPNLALPDWLEESLYSTTTKQISHIFPKKGAVGSHPLSHRHLEKESSLSSVFSPVDVPSSLDLEYPVEPSLSSRNGVRPEGPGAGQAPGLVVVIGLSEFNHKRCESVSSDFNPEVAITSLLRDEKEARTDEDCKTASGGSEPGPDGARISPADFKALQARFGRWLTQAKLPANEKVRLGTWAIDPDIPMSIRSQRMLKLMTGDAGDG
jgi:hypothetical protein